MRGFLDFIRQRGVMGLAIGFILGGAVSRVVTALVNDLINPVLGIVLGKIDLANSAIEVGSSKILWGDFISNVVDFLVIALVVYVGVKWLKLDKLEKQA